MNPYLQYMYSYPHKTAYRPLTGVFFPDYAGRLAGEGHSLYLHIPFCQSKCGYCNLFSVTGQDEDAVSRYLDRVERQIRYYQNILGPVGTRFAELAIGGGTPLLLTEAQIDRVFGMMGRYGSFQDIKTIIIETAPNQTTDGKLRRLKEAGITRISMGIQSFSGRELAVLGRNHCADQARQALKRIKAFDFPCVNLDFIYGIPGQKTESLLASLKEAVSYEPDELFLYPLYVKHGAGLVQKAREGMALDPQEAFRQYQAASAFLCSEGFRQDSMRRFVRLPRGLQNEGGGGAGRTFQDCGFGTSLALGCGGRSYLGNLHFCTPYAITQKSCRRQIREFMENEDDGRIKHGMILSREEEKRRYVIRHLLIRPGLPAKQYKMRFSAEAKADFPILDTWIREGFLECRREESEMFFCLTGQGMGLSDYLGPQLISDEVRRRMEEWDRIYGK